jgi:hypothetical protein
MTAELFKNNHEAKVAFQFLKYSDCPVFLTGKAGTGKSTFIEWAKSITPSCLVLAPTGLAAQNVGGRTIHSAFKLPKSFIFPDERDFFLYQKYSKEFFAEMQQYEMIIIDEISMVNSSVIFLMDRILKRVCDSEKLFGGKKLLMVGDPLQLPPIIENQGDSKKLKIHFGGEYFFDSDVFKKNNIIKIQLKTIYRQSDEGFCKILNNIREGTDLESSLKKLNSQVSKEYRVKDVVSKSSGIALTFKKIDADQINVEELNKLKGDIHELEAELWGDIDISQIAVEKSIRMKVDAKVMFTKNHASGKYYNGTIGTVKSISPDCIIIEDLFGKVIKVERAVWTNQELRSKKVGKKKVFEKKIVGSCKQYPLKLAWAITVHKSQGLTFDNIDIRNYRPVYFDSLIYVALSRCKTIEGIRLHSAIHSSEIRFNLRMDKFNDTAWDRKRLDNYTEEVYDCNILERFPETFSFQDLEGYTSTHKWDYADFPASDVLGRMLALGMITDEGNDMYRNMFFETDDQPPEKPKSKLAHVTEWL